jgi:hypothetical protein
MEEFDATAYGSQVARLLSLDGDGLRPLPLTSRPCSSPQAQAELKRLTNLFTDSADPDAANAGLWLYFSCFDEAHDLVSNSTTPECEFWHAILHRQEPDSGNAAYWFRRVGHHPVFSKIAQAAKTILDRHPQAEFRIGKWDPFAFIAFCERARLQPATDQEQAALEIQLAEWQILFDYCARKRGHV